MLQGVAQDDLAGIVAGRSAGHTPVQALRAHYRTAAATRMAEVDRAEVIARIRVILDSPALSGTANALLYQQRRALAEVLAEEHGPTRAALMAAQIAASLLTLQESFFHLLVGGASPQEAARALAEDAELAFDLLEHGIDHSGGQ